MAAPADAWRDIRARPSVIMRRLAPCLVARWLEDVMRGSICSGLAALALGIPAVVLAAGERTPVGALVETTLSTASEQIRQLAFDGDEQTYFASVNDARAADHFTLVFDRPINIASIAVLTGRPDGSHQLDAGTIEVSADGKEFVAIRSIEGGAGRTGIEHAMIRAVRVKPALDLRHPLAIRELAIASDPPVTTFKYPVEFVVDVSDAPEMKQWAENAARVCAAAYPIINEELKSDGFTPPRLLRMVITPEYKGVAATSGTRIMGSAKYFKDHPDDVGAMIHETVHVVQHYQGRNNPGWLVEGVADYVRFFKFERGKIGRIDPERARYNRSYRVSAAFLAYLAEAYDTAIVAKLNAIIREGKYKEEVFEELTGKPIQELDDEWRARLRR
jgi:hypothetical protein